MIVPPFELTLNLRGVAEMVGRIDRGGCFGSAASSTVLDLLADGQKIAIDGAAAIDSEDGDDIEERTVG